MIPEEVLRDVSADWRELLLPGLEPILNNLRPYMDHLCPPASQILEFARFVEPCDIKVIIIGQDPYHTPGHAHGLAFSSKIGVPSSLKNIYRCLGLGVERNGDLTNWAQQGVLLINSVLTTRCGAPRAHSKIWGKYVLNMLARLCSGGVMQSPPIIMLWGHDAQKLGVSLRAEDPEAVIMNWAHPSPLAQIHLPQELRFVNCPHFKDANTLLARDGRSPIRWV